MHSFIKSYLPVSLQFFKTLKLENTNLESIPESISELKELEFLSLVNNKLSSLPASIESARIYFFITFIRNFSP